MSRPSFINLLSDDVVRRIWHLCENETRFDFIETSIFKCVLSDEVQRLMIHAESDAVYSDGTVAIKENNSSSKFKQILKLYGNSFNSLELRFSEDASKSDFLAGIIEFCTRLSSLYIKLEDWDFSYSEFFEHIGGKLNIVELESYDAEFTKVAVLHLAATCKNITKFRFIGRGITMLNPIWISSGINLKQAAIRARFESEADWAMTLNSLGLACTGLSGISLSGPTLDGVQVADLLIRYGDQLEEVMVTKICAFRAIDVARACTNIRRCVVIERDTNFRRIQALGEKITELFIYIDSDYDGEILKRTIGRCISLTKLVVDCIDDISYIPYLFSKPKYTLEVLQLNLEEVRRADLDLIGLNTGNLKRLSIDAGSVEDNEGELFHAIARNNISMEAVSLVIEEPGLSFQEAMNNDKLVNLACDMAYSFMECENLKVFELINRKLTGPFPHRIATKIRDSFIKYHHRKVCVFVYGARL